MIIKYLPETRLEFLWLRLAVSGVVLALFIGLVRLVWYPGLHFQLSGALGNVAIAAGVALVIGPGLTTFVYKRGKKGLLLDVWVIFAVEVVALSFAATELYERRPEFMVFAIDRFEAVAASKVGEFPFRHEELAAGGVLSGPTAVIARFPDDSEERADLKYSILFDGQPDIDRRPDHWYPYASGTAAVLESSRPLQELRDVAPEYQGAVDRWLWLAPGELADYRFVSVQGNKRDAVAVVEVATGQPVGMIDLDPWI